MHLRYDEDFVEAAVQLGATGRRKSIPSLQIARFNREREKLYDILDPDERNAAFFRLHLEWFREWGMEKLLTGPLADFPLLPKALGILAFRKSRGKHDDGAELYVNEAGERHGVVAMRPERLDRETELAAYLRHELTHLQDMVDPGFGYQPDLPATGPSLSQQRLARERYRLLWDVTIDGRLTRAGHPTVASRNQRWTEFAAGFDFWTEARQREVFDSLWTNPSPTHQRLQELVCDPRQLQAATGPRPGGPCPLCGFPTFAWATEGGLSEPTLRAIGSEFPHWSQPQGVCVRCAEVYHVKARVSDGSKMSAQVRQTSVPELQVPRAV
jgi:hypothetical protein